MGNSSKPCDCPPVNQVIYRGREYEVLDIENTEYGRKGKRNRDRKRRQVRIHTLPHGRTLTTGIEYPRGVLILQVIVAQPGRLRKVENKKKRTVIWTEKEE